MFARNAFRAAARQTRGYATAPQGKSSNLGLYLAAAGAAGLGAYAYLQRSEKKKELPPAVPGLSNDSWTALKLDKVEPYNHNTKVYKFVFDGEDAENKTTDMTVSGVVLVKSPEGVVVDDKGKPVIRPYTPLSHKDQRGSIDLMIKEYPTGKLTPWLSSLKPGEEVLFKGPMTKLEYKPNNVDKALFVAGGSGVTPAYQLIKHALNDKTDKTKFTFIFANVSEQDILLRKEWESLAAANPDRLKVVFFLDKAPEGWKGEEGYVTADKIKKHFPRAEGEKVLAYVCGPPGQYAAVSGPKKGREQGPVGGVLAELGYTSEEVFKF